MGRKKLIRSDHFPYHVTARTNNRVLFPVALNFIWQIATEELYVLSILYEIEIQGFVLMPNHIHLLITVPKEDLGVIMRNFLSVLTRRVNGLSGQTGHLLGGPYFWTMITSTRYFGHALKYLYRNPIRAGLCEKVEEYEFSTASGLLGQTHLPFPIHFTRIGLEINLPDPEISDAWIEWLNRPFTKEAEELIQRSLKKRKLKELINRNTRRPYDELSRLI
jgi:putative transposase